MQNRPSSSLRYASSELLTSPFNERNIGEPIAARVSSLHEVNVTWLTSRVILSVATIVSSGRDVLPDGAERASVVQLLKRRAHCFPSIATKRIESTALNGVICSTATTRGWLRFHNSTGLRQNEQLWHRACDVAGRPAGCRVARNPAQPGIDFVIRPLSHRPIGFRYSTCPNLPDDDPARATRMCVPPTPTSCRSRPHVPSPRLAGQAGERSCRSN